MGSFDLLTESYVQEHEYKKKTVQELLSSKVTPQILDALKKKCQSLYEDVMQEAPEYDVKDLPHVALCEETIDSDTGQQKNFLHFLQARQVESCDDVIKTFDNLEKIQATIQEQKDKNLVTLM
jgi:histidine ammonia-lyase